MDENNIDIGNVPEELFSINSGSMLQINDPTPPTITFHTGGSDSPAMLELRGDGFYVRGKLVSGDEGPQVYEAFLKWMNMHTDYENLNKENRK